MRLRALEVGLALILAAGCAPRQAVVQSDPRGGEEARSRLRETVRSDLETLLEAQDDHRARAGRYSYDSAEIGFVPSAGVEVDILEATADGFSAVARAGTNECALFVGTADPPRSYTLAPAEVACRT